LTGRLEAERVSAALDWIETHGRPLEQAAGRLEFGGGRAEAAWEALRSFQNLDGGFGCALEPDFRTPASSVLATSVAFQHLARTEAPEDHPLVWDGIQYLLRAYDAKVGRWPAVPPEVNDAPRAPWWEYDPEQASRPGFAANPSAEVIGWLHRYPTRVPPDFLQETTHRALEYLRDQADGMEMHDALCYLRLAEQLRGGDRQQVADKLRRVVAAIVPKASDSWADYGATPLQFAPSPDSLLAGCFDSEVLQRNLDFLIDRQQPDGCWAPNWSWGRFPSDWERARKEWQGILTLEALRALRGYGRLA
jgi:hypothetical protein